MPWDSSDYIRVGYTDSSDIYAVDLSYLDYEHIFGPPADVHVFPSARKSEVTITMTPKAAQMKAGSLVRLYQAVL